MKYIYSNVVWSSCISISCESSSKSIFLFSPKWSITMWINVLRWARVLLLHFTSHSSTDKRVAILQTLLSLRIHLPNYGTGKHLERRRLDDAADHGWPSSGHYHWRGRTLGASAGFSLPISLIWLESRQRETRHTHQGLLSFAHVNEAFNYVCNTPRMNGCVINRVKNLLVRPYLLGIKPIYYPYRKFYFTWPFSIFSFNFFCWETQRN